MKLWKLIDCARPKAAAWAKSNALLKITIAPVSWEKRSPERKDPHRNARLLLGLRALDLSDAEIVNLLLWIETGEEQYKPVKPNK